jgi:hypothetical protein
MSFLVEGFVFDAVEEFALAGVNVLVKDTSIGTVTNLSGEYAVLATSAGSTLEFSMIGYDTLDVPIQNRTHINVWLTPSPPSE